MWSRVIWTTREIVLKGVVALEYSVVCDVSRYLAAFSWALRDKLRSSSTRARVRLAVPGVSWRVRVHENATRTRAHACVHDCADASAVLMPPWS